MNLKSNFIVSAIAWAMIAFGGYSFTHFLHDFILWEWSLPFSSNGYRGVFSAWAVIAIALVISVDRDERK